MLEVCQYDTMTVLNRWWRFRHRSLFRRLRQVRDAVYLSTREMEQIEHFTLTFLPIPGLGDTGYYSAVDRTLDLPITFNCGEARLAIYYLLGRTRRLALESARLPEAFCTNPTYQLTPSEWKDFLAASQRLYPEKAISLLAELSDDPRLMAYADYLVGYDPSCRALTCAMRAACLSTHQPDLCHALGAW